MPSNDYARAVESSAKRLGQTRAGRSRTYLAALSAFTTCARSMLARAARRGARIRRWKWQRNQQVLLADAYGGYNGVVAGNQITRAGCWSHARRKFIDAEKVAPEMTREAVEWIGVLFRVERQAKDSSVEERLALRQAQSAPVLAKLREKLLGWKEQLLPKHPMAEAVNYALSQWPE